ncbi:DUF533 domain-containing protein [Yoonia sp.]|uniref:DUF533 domain-containing protein n=1 Tax=Yoonia sp. TaxID=2212373 RepID=UPI002DFB1BC4|nr:DUF533 domain-containing protein [Yoonia sp.]
MSLMNTVAKMAVGFAVAKGMESVQKNGGLGGLLGGLTGGSTPKQASGMGGLGDILGQLGGGGAAQTSGGLGGMLGQLTGGAAASGGLGGLLGQLGGSSSSAAAAGGLGGLGALLGGLAGARGETSGTELEALLNQDNPADEPDEDEVAKLMLRAMIQAARADGDLDQDEKAKLSALLADSNPGTVETLQTILSAPVSAAALAADTPKGLETQVYTMSVNAITPDNQAEAQYLHDLASALGITPQTADAIHDSLGAPRLYS